ncbi:glycosyltransferase family 2 protein [Microlunatus flavus]|uniref:Glycosyltransferase involved in cell wall bisynthesis n=1 Tax=Microlunatus flavus TaxID=1036181 RepID=A0A1H8Z3L2_9ACTN|nr:glycosyltransferase family 2 protein [Microlunatus flavus]SEP58943.1 Glycosyltransferase involved in cell wall bisynthesis [Microlunatus flavus]
MTPEPTPSPESTSTAPGRLFTVGIPVYNGRGLLRACLASVVRADFPHERYEVVLADDGSTEPETLAILRELEAAHADEPGFVRVLRLPENSGGAARPRNLILDEAVGEYVFFVDADDTVGSESLRRIADALAETPDEPPVDWIALHQALVNGRQGAARVKQARLDVPRMKAFSTLTVHKVFRRAEIERQRLRFDDRLPSGQDVTFAFSYILGASRFLMLGGYDYYYLTRHAGNPEEPPHLSRTANTAKRLIDKNHRILTSMLADLNRSELPMAERLDVLGNVALPRVLVQQRYLTSIVSEGPRAGARELLRLSALLDDPLAVRLDPARLQKAFTAEQLAVVRAADWPALAELLAEPGDTAKAPPSRTERWVRLGRRVSDAATGRGRHRRVLHELTGLRTAVRDLQKAQARLEAEVREALGRGPTG